MFEKFQCKTKKRKREEKEGRKEGREEKEKKSQQTFGGITLERNLLKEYRKYAWDKGK